MVRCYSGLSLSTARVSRNAGFFAGMARVARSAGVSGTMQHGSPELLDGLATLPRCYTGLSAGTARVSRNAGFFAGRARVSRSAGVSGAMQHGSPQLLDGLATCSLVTPALPSAWPGFPAVPGSAVPMESAV